MFSFSQSSEKIGPVTGSHGPSQLGDDIIEISVQLFAEGPAERKEL